MQEARDAAKNWGHNDRKLDDNKDVWEDGELWVYSRMSNVYGQKFETADN